MSYTDATLRNSYICLGKLISYPPFDLFHPSFNPLKFHLDLIVPPLNTDLE